MVSLTASVDDAARQAFNAAMKDYSGAMGKYAAVAPKVAALTLCDSLRHNTKKAPKRKKPRDWAAVVPKWGGGFREIEKTKDGKTRKFKIPTPSPYVTNPRDGRHGKSNGMILHRWQFTNRKGTDAETTFPVYAYAHIKHGKGGRFVKDLAAEKAEIRKYRAVNIKAGLAQKSWNWAKKDIGGEEKDTAYKRRKNDRRDPRDSVRASYRKTTSPAKSSGVAEIHNHLDYIQSALKNCAMDTALKAAATKLAYKSAMAHHMTPQEAADYAKNLVAGFVKDAA